MKKLIMLLFFISTTAMANPVVIYGEDNRKDVYDDIDPLFKELSRSTAAMIPEIIVSGDPDDDGNIKIQNSALNEQGICKKERFSHQTSVANCSGFLISETKLVTAGHCMKNQQACDRYKWVFDYKIDSAEQNRINIPFTSIYGCHRIIKQVFANKNDYAVIELDRPVTDRRPLEIRKSGTVAVGDELVVIGHPSGLPTKVADGAKVRSLKNYFFVADLDTFGGNSGSAVFHEKTGLVEGILVRGENDYVDNTELSCKEVRVCAQDGCNGEAITYITNIL